MKLLIMFMALSSPSLGAVYYVSPSGNDANNGTSTSTPWRHVNTAVSRLVAGDTLNLRAGTYFETVTASVSGTSGNVITIQSYQGETATIDSGTAAFNAIGNTNWALFNGAIGEYASTSTFPAGTGTNNTDINAYITTVAGYVNKWVVLVPYLRAADFRSTNYQYVNGTTSYYAGPGIFWDSNDSKIHIRLSKTPQMTAAESRYGTVLANDNDNPANYGIVLSEAQNTLTVSGSFLTFKNIQFNPAHFTIDLTATATNDSFIGNTVWQGYYGVYADTVANFITLDHNSFFGDGSYWIFWNDVNDSDFMSPGAVANNLGGSNLEVNGQSHDWTVSYNYFRGSANDHFEAHDAPYNFFVHHNRFEGAHDDSVEIRGYASPGAGLWQVYENFFLNNLTSLSAGQSAVAWTGPIYYYRNVSVQLKMIPVNRTAGAPEAWDYQAGASYGYEYTFKINGSGYLTANTHIYHNTVVLINTGTQGINLTPNNPANCFVADNIVIGINDTLNQSYITASGEVVDHNLYWKMNSHDTNHLLGGFDTVPLFSASTGFEVHGIGSTVKQGTDPQFTNWPIAPLDPTQAIWVFPPSQEQWLYTSFLLGASSPAIAAGIANPSGFPDDRSSNDIGALPFGNSGSDYTVFPFVLGAQSVSVQGTVAVSGTVIIE